jgi:hypothetical protein
MTQAEGMDMPPFERLVLKAMKNMKDTMDNIQHQTEKKSASRSGSSVPFQRSQLLEAGVSFVGAVKNCPLAAKLLNKRKSREPKIRWNPAAANETNLGGNVVNNLNDVFRDKYYLVAQQKLRLKGTKEVANWTAREGDVLLGIPYDNVAEDVCEQFYTMTGNKALLFVAGCGQLKTDTSDQIKCDDALNKLAFNFLHASQHLTANTTQLGFVAIGLKVQFYRFNESGKKAFAIAPVGSEFTLGSSVCNLAFRNAAEIWNDIAIAHAVVDA